MKYLILYKSFLLNWIKGGIRQNIIIILTAVTAVFAFVSSYSGFLSTYTDVSYADGLNGYYINIASLYSDEGYKLLTEKMPPVKYTDVLDGEFYYKYDGSYCCTDYAITRYADSWRNIYRYINPTYTVYEGRDFTEEEICGSNCGLVIASADSGFSVNSEIEIPSDSGESIKLKVIGVADRFVLPMNFFLENSTLCYTNPKNGRQHTLSAGSQLVYFEKNLTDEQLNEIATFTGMEYVSSTENEVDAGSRVLVFAVNFVVCVMAAVFTALQIYTQFLHLGSKSSYQISVAKITGCKDRVIIAIMLLLCLTYIAVAFVMSLAFMPLFENITELCRLNYAPTAVDFVVSFVILSAVILLAVFPGIKRIASAPLNKGRE